MADLDLVLRNGLPVAAPRTQDRGLIGEIKAYAGLFLPTGFAWCDGATVSIATYPQLFFAIGNAYGSTATGSAFTLATTNGSTLITSSSAHGYSVGSPVCSIAFLNSDAPTPNSYGIDSKQWFPYHVVEVVSSTTFRAALVGSTTPISFTYTGSGLPARTEMKLPDLRGRSIFGRDNFGGTAANRLESTPSQGEYLANVGGADTHLLLSSESGLPAHYHDFTDRYRVVNSVNRTSGGAATNVPGGLDTLSTNTLNVTAANAANAHNNMPPFGIAHFIIRTS